MTEKANAYLARSMPEDEDEPIYAFRIGDTLQGAKDAIEDVTENVAPVAVENIEWKDDSDGENARAKSGSWYFQVNRYYIHGEE